MCWGDGSVRLVKYDRYVWLSREWYLLMQITGKNDGYSDDDRAILE
jgi:hypothetical protein